MSDIRKTPDEWPVKKFHGLEYMDGIKKYYHRRKQTPKDWEIIWEIGRYGIINANRWERWYGKTGKYFAHAPFTRQKLLEFIRKKVPCKVEDYYAALRVLPYWIRIEGKGGKMSLWVQGLWA